MSSAPNQSTAPTAAIETTPFETHPDRNEENTLTLPSGRKVGYAIYGVSPSASPHPPVFYLHGYPASRLEACLASRKFQEANLSLVAIDRPGFGLSTEPVIPFSSRTVLDHVADIEALADHLKIPRFVVLGISGGGPSAFASAYSIPPSRLIGVGVLAGMGPYSLVMTKDVWKELWWVNKAGFILPVRVTRLYRILYKWMVPYLLKSFESVPYEKTINDKQFHKSPQADQDVVLALGKEGYADSFRIFREALRQPNWSYWHVDEARLLAKPWPFELKDIPAGEAGEEGKVPVKLWYGELDTSTPAALGRKIKEQMPGAQLEVVENGTHSSVVMQYLLKASKELLGIQ